MGDGEYFQSITIDLTFVFKPQWILMIFSSIWGHLGYDYYIVWLETQFEVWKETYAKSNSLTGGSLDINFANQTLYSIKQTQELLGSQRLRKITEFQTKCPRTIPPKIASWKSQIHLTSSLQTEVQVKMRVAIVFCGADTISYKLETIF